MSSKKTNRWLYKFSINKEVEKEESTTSKNDKGEDITVTKTVTTEEPVHFGIRKPTRKMFDGGELFYGVTLSQGIKSGLLTKAQLSKRYDNDGGVLSEPDKEKYAQLYLELFELENELQRAQLNLEKASESKKKEELSSILEKMNEVRMQVQEFESAQSNIFDQTAENRARNKTIMWWVLHLAHTTDEKGEALSPFFGEGDYDERLENYDLKEEDGDLHIIEAMRKFAYFISYWYNGQANTEEEFANIDKALDQDEEEVEEEAEEKAEKPKDKESKDKEPKDKEPKDKEPKVEKSEDTKEVESSSEEGSKEEVKQESPTKERVIEAKDKHKSENKSEGRSKNKANQTA
tara:strand:+ start:2168 stop:3211 length:1044 start_codon:yes stop_codon:yes gene_type:complete